MSALEYKVEGLGKRLKELREKKGLKQDELAKKTGIGRSSISLYEVELATPTYTNLIKLAQELDSSTDYLLGYEPERYIDLSGIGDKQKRHIEELYNMFMSAGATR